MRQRRGAARGAAALAALLLAAAGVTASGAEAGSSGSGDAAGPAPRLRPLHGEAHHVFLDLEDTLLDVAHRYRLGFEAVARLNPDVDPWLTAPGTVVHLPTRMILPDAPEEGLVINVPEMRLYDFTAPDPPQVLAVAVGDAADPTPIGRFRIGRKRADPTWNVPRSIREERPELPARVPPGPDNPLGSRWMTIGDSSYGIHGTNVRWSIGREATHGCVRLYEPEMQVLFARTEEGTPLSLVYQPFKWGIDGTRLYIEVHPDLYARTPDRLASALAVPRALGLLDRIRLEEVWRAVDEARGVPVWVGSVPASETERLRDAGTSAATSSPSS